MISTQYLNFTKIRDTGKTTVWEVTNKDLGIRLGEIKWYGPWRKYCFFPETHLIFDIKCLEDIVNTIRIISSM